MNIKLYRWERALDIAVNNKTHVDTVIAYRTRFLQQYSKEEDIDKFKQYSRDIQADWTTVKAKIRADKDKEAASA
jgi:intraflagellar transport protein 80